MVAVLELEASEDSSPDEHAEASRPTVATSATDASARVPAREELSHIFPILSPGKVSASPGGERSAAPYPAATAQDRSARCRVDDGPHAPAELEFAGPYPVRVCQGVEDLGPRDHSTCLTEVDERRLVRTRIEGIL